MKKEQDLVITSEELEGLDNDIRSFLISILSKTAMSGLTWDNDIQIKTRLESRIKSYFNILNHISVKRPKIDKKIAKYFELQLDKSFEEKRENIQNEIIEDYNKD